MGFLDNLNNPAARLGLRMLANNRWNSNLGSSFGEAALGDQQDQQASVDNAMRQQLMQAQIAKMNAPDPDADLRRQLLQAQINEKNAPPGSASGIRELEIARALSDPNVPDSVKRDLRAQITPRPTTAPQPTFPAGYRPSLTGGLEFIPGGPADPAVIASKNPAISGADGLNERQRSGVNMQQESAIMYAASLTKKTPEEVRAVLAKEGPDGVSRMMLESGDRFLQGGMARFATQLPLGQLAVDSANSDLIAPVKSGGAGIALSQNPTGAITGTDIQAGEAQMPNALYPLKTQAEMVRQMLLKGGAAPAPQAAPQASSGVVDWNQLDK